MGLLVDRQFKVCGKCGGKIQVDHSQSPGDVEDGPPKITYVEMHIGSCFPKPDETVMPDNSNAPAAAAPAPVEPPVHHERASRSNR